MLEQLHKISPEILVVLSAALLLISWFLLRGFLKHLMGDIQRIMRKLDFVIIEQQSTDRALNDSFKNGYSKSKEDYKKKLLDEYEFKNKVKVDL